MAKQSQSKTLDVANGNSKSIEDRERSKSQTRDANATPVKKADENNRSSSQPPTTGKHQKEMADGAQASTKKREMSQNQKHRADPSLESGTT
jgi:hypothetical protein